MAIRPPRRSVRLRLTLLYGGLFLVSGTALLIITYVLVAHRFPTVAHAQSVQAGGTVQPGGSGQAQYIAGPGTACQPGPAATVSPGQLTKCAAQAQATLARQQAGIMNELLIQSGVALAIMAVTSIGLGWLVAGRVLAPLRTITTAAQRISAASLHQRLALPGPHDELKELGDTFDALLARLEAAFDAQRQFVANASHELRTPMTRQRTLIELALTDPDRTAGSLSHTCRRVLAAGEEQERLIEALLILARGQRGLDRREPVDLAVLTGGVLAARQAGASHRGLTAGASLGPACLLGDARLTERLAANLIDNAVAHNVPGGWIQVTTGEREGQPFLSVANTGPVIPQAEVGRLFEPFHRQGADRTRGDGLGLGLSIVWAIAVAHGARLRVSARPRGGLDIQVRFPPLPPPATCLPIPPTSALATAPAEPARQAAVTGLDIWPAGRGAFLSPPGYPGDHPGPAKGAAVQSHNDENQSMLQRGTAGVRQECYGEAGLRWVDPSRNRRKAASHRI
jgi:signal transduction histidine kinase